MFAQIIGLAVSIFLGYVMLAAALHKWLDRPGFRQIMAAYELLPGHLLGMAVILLAGLETLAGLALLVPAVRAPGALAAALLLGIYLVAMAINLWRGKRDLDCGCSFGRGKQPLQIWHLVRNAILVLLCLFASGTNMLLTMIWLDWCTALGTATCLALVYFIVEQLAANHRQLRNLRYRT